jgi:hypothetical protein
MISAWSKAVPDSLNNKPMLTDKIDELESLLNDQREPSSLYISPVPQFGMEIPILDDLVSAEDYDDYPEQPDFELDEAEPRLEQIADELELKLSQELDEIVGLLKANMKENILNELQTLLNNEPHKKTDT